MLNGSSTISHNALLEMIEDSSRIKSVIYSQGDKHWSEKEIQEAIEETLNFHLPITEMTQAFYDKLKVIFNGQCVNGEEAKEFTLDIDGEEIEQVLIRESNSGLYFSVDASYVEQDVDVVISPYRNGAIVLAEDAQ
tara:strand:+ start:415 stop:822 length:408 start_codon:yes stop_codon:yes gene_type:complete